MKTREELQIEREEREHRLAFTCEIIRKGGSYEPLPPRQPVVSVAESQPQEEKVRMPLRTVKCPRCHGTKLRGGRLEAHDHLVMGPCEECDERGMTQAVNWESFMGTRQ